MISDNVHLSVNFFEKTFFDNLYENEKKALSNVPDGYLNKKLGNECIKFNNKGISFYLQAIDGITKCSAISADKTSAMDFNFLDGVKHGKEIFVKKDNFYLLQQNYVKGVLEGEVLEKNSAWTKKFTYVAGVKHGKVCFNLKNGFSQEATYVNGELEGNAKITFSNKHLILGKLHKNKFHGLSVKFNDKGNRLCEITFLNGVKEGPAKCYLSDGSVVYLTFKNDKREGVSTRFFPNGDWNETLYKNGQAIYEQWVVKDMDLTDSSDQEDELSKIANEVTLINKDDIFDDFAKKCFQD